MTWNGAVWMASGYLVGTFPSTYVVARAKRATGLLSAAARSEGESDAHVLMAKYVGVWWTAAAATLDVLKGLLFVLAAREIARLPLGWLALTGVALVLGHSFPFYAREMAGRGLATAAGVFLVLLPIQMVVCGLLIVLGRAIRATSVATTVGLISVPLLGGLQGQPRQLVAMAAAILVIVLIRRLEGVGEVIASGVRPWRAVVYRAVYDSSGPPSSDPWHAGEENPRIS